MRRMQFVDARIRRDCLRRTRGDGKWSEEDQDEIQDSGCDEETKHPVRSEASDFKGIGDITWERNYG